MDIISILVSEYPESEWSIDGNVYENLVWHSDTPKPTEAELHNLWESVNLKNALSALREKRNKLLFDSDWTQLNDAQVNKDAWASYRQALRDLPETTIDPFNPIWPQQP